MNDATQPPSPQSGRSLWSWIGLGIVVIVIGAPIAFVGVLVFANWSRGYIRHFEAPSPDGRWIVEHRQANDKSGYTTHVKLRDRKGSWDSGRWIAVVSGTLPMRVADPLGQHIFVEWLSSEELSVSVAVGAAAALNPIESGPKVTFRPASDDPAAREIIEAMIAKFRFPADAHGWIDPADADVMWGAYFRKRPPVLADAAGAQRTLVRSTRWRFARVQNAESISCRIDLETTPIAGLTPRFAINSALVQSMHQNVPHPMAATFFRLEFSLVDADASPVHAHYGGVQVSNSTFASPLEGRGDGYGISVGDPANVPVVSIGFQYPMDAMDLLRALRTGGVVLSYQLRWPERLLTYEIDEAVDSEILASFVECAAALKLRWGEGREYFDLRMPK